MQTAWAALDDILTSGQDRSDVSVRYMVVSRLGLASKSGCLQCSQLRNIATHPLCLLQDMAPVVADFLRHEATTTGKLPDRAVNLLRRLQGVAELAYVRHTPSARSRSGCDQAVQSSLPSQAN